LSTEFYRNLLQDGEVLEYLTDEQRSLLETAKDEEVAKMLQRIEDVQRWQVQDRLLTDEQVEKSVAKDKNDVIFVPVDDDVNYDVFVAKAKEDQENDNQGRYDDEYNNQENPVKHLAAFQQGIKEALNDSDSEDSEEAQEQDDMQEDADDNNQRNPFVEGFASLSV
jgi:E3 ubiquitin-protein ligase DOA10